MKASRLAPKSGIIAESIGPYEPAKFCPPHERKASPLLLRSLNFPVFETLWRLMLPLPLLASDEETGSVEELFVLSVLIEGMWTLLSNHVLIAPGT